MKIYLAGPPEDGDEYVETKIHLEAQGHEVVCNPSTYRDMRLEIAELTTCEGICLMELWWSDLPATMLQTIASWLRLKFVDEKGTPVPTSGLGGLG